MFIEQSAGRRRVVRFLFLAMGLVPCCALGAVAWWRHSAGHRAAIERDVAAHLGLPVSIGRVIHPRPGAVRLVGVVVGRGAGMVEVPEVEVETTATEVRLCVPRFECDPGSARLLGELAAEWLRRPSRFQKSWVVDVADVAWRFVEDGRRDRPSGWHAECVVADEARAVRVRREPEGGDEIRVRAAGDTLAVEGMLTEGVPVAIVAAIADGAGGSVSADAFGTGAVVLGRIDMSDGGAGWNGTFTGRVERFDLAAVPWAKGRGVRGEATLAFEPLRLAAGRIVACNLGVSAREGTMSQDFLDSLVATLGCRPGPAYRSLGGDAVRRFDEFGCALRLDGDLLRITSGEAAHGGLVRYQGLSLVDEPVGPQPAARTAWLLAPAGRPAMPAFPAAAWLMSVLPDSGGATGF